MKHWYVIQVLSAKEKQVKQALDENKATSPHGQHIEEIILPTEKVMEVKQGQQKSQKDVFGQAIYWLKWN